MFYQELIYFSLLNFFVVDCIDITNNKRLKTTQVICEDGVWV